MRLFKLPVQSTTDTAMASLMLSDHAYFRIWPAASPQVNTEGPFNISQFFIGFYAVE